MILILILRALIPFVVSCLVVHNQATRIMNILEEKEKENAKTMLL